MDSIVTGASAQNKVGRLDAHEIISDARLDAASMKMALQRFTNPELPERFGRAKWCTASMSLLMSVSSGVCSRIHRITTASVATGWSVSI
ncbi:hypothetical protein IM725_17445 [Ramlibacter aquaticus]|uniref:Uncharacterized protein n=2 Tax=Ramlibacter TaxID=174951 RepID=A0ABR9SJ47_9BURK|nr:hypothetical protein [Ramlibacter aquaticus]MBE7942357.1 hypothetical protein [Ramlibacter aquaticus]